MPNLPDNVDWRQYETYTKSGAVRYVVELRHGGIGKFRVVRDSDARIVREKALAVVKTWQKQWKAAQLTAQAKESLEELRNILVSSLTRDHSIMLDSSALTFPSEPPLEPELLPNPPKPKLKNFPPKPENIQESTVPKPHADKYQPIIGFRDLFSRRSRREKAEAARKRYEEDLREWEKGIEKLREERLREWEAKVKGVKKYNEKIMTKWKLRVFQAKFENSRRIADYEKQLEAWEKRRDKHEARAKSMLVNYSQKELSSVEAYCSLVLEGSPYPRWFPKEFELQYIPDTSTVVVDYLFPTLDDIPKTKEVAYIQKRDEFQEKELSQKEQQKLYDSLLYQIALRTIYELFDADTANAIDEIVFNGFVRSIDKATGKPVRPCILSIQATKEEFAELDLANVDPKACFKRLKGVGSSQLHMLAPIAPILNLDKEDSRFIAAREVINGVDEAINVAAMDWGDFEHLIRELFEAEFAERGAEVKITQASRDRGVDAVVFDPDPITGGKIIIQAKRYTNVVGAGDVRELFGVVEAEGANKGILVTTSDYGPDAYKWAKGKPLTLLNGSNLLHLLDKHGHKAKIDLKEAKQILSEEALG